jgi:MFS family permease
MLRIRIENAPLLVGITCGFIVGVFLINIAPQAISGLMDAYAFSESQAGLVNTVEIAAGAISCTFLSPILLVRFEHRSLIVAGSAAIIAAGFGTLFLEDITAIIILRALAGLGAGLILASASAALALARDPDRMFAEISVAITLLMSVMIYLLAGVKASWGYSGLMIVFSGVVLLLCYPMLRLIPETKVEDTATSAPLREVLLGAGGVGALSMFVFTVLESGIWNFAERASINAGISEQQIAQLLTISMASGLLGAVMTIVAGKMFGRELPIITGCVLIGLFGFFIYNPPSPIFLIVSIALLNLAFFFTIPFLFGGCAECDSEGRMSAIAAGMQAAGGAIGPFFAGFIVENYGSSVLANTCLALAGIAAVLGVSMAAILRKGSADRELLGQSG